MKDLDASMAREAVRGTAQQAVVDLAAICSRVSESSDGWPQLATQLDSLSSELAQAAGWLRGVSGQGVSTMSDGHENNALHDLLEHERAKLFAARRVREQLAVIAAQAPGYLITTEYYPGRRERFVAKAISPVVHPHLVMTDDLDELFIELRGPVGSARIISFTAPTAEGGDDEVS